MPPPPDPGFNAPDPADPLGGLLPSLCLVPHMALDQLFTTPGDYLPQEVTRLTGVGQAESERFGRACRAGADALAAFLAENPPRAYYLLRLGRFALDTPLGEGVFELLHRHNETAAALGLSLRELFDLLLAHAMAQLVAALPDDGTDYEAVDAELHALFAQEKYGLRSLVFPRPAPPEPVAESEALLEMTPNADDLRLFGMAVTSTRAAPFFLDHPLARALAEVPALGGAGPLTALADRLLAHPVDTLLLLDEADTLRLYLCLQATVLLFVYDLQPRLMERFAPPDAPDRPWEDAALQQQTTEWVCRQVAEFSQLAEEYYGELPSFQAAQAQAQRLAGLM